MLTHDEELCRRMYKTVSEDVNVLIRAVIYGINATMGLVFNSALIIGIYKTRRNKKFTRNEKLVLFLSLIDLITAVESATSPCTMKSFYKINCLLISGIGFFNVLVLNFSGSVILVISLERLIAISNMNRCCGFIFRGIHLIPILMILMVLNAGFCVWYAFVGVTRDFTQQSIFYLSIGTYRVLQISAITVINILLLKRTKIMLSSINVQRNLRIERQLTKTVIIISIVLVVMHLPLVFSEYYMGRVISLKSISPTTAVTFLSWSPVLCQLNSTINALIFICKNRRISLMYKNYHTSIRTISEK